VCVCACARLCSSLCSGLLQSRIDIRVKDILEREDQFRRSVTVHQMLYVLSKSCGLADVTLITLSFR